MVTCYDEALHTHQQGGAVGAFSGGIRYFATVKMYMEKVLQDRCS